MANFRVHPAGSVACFVIKREDGNELSFSSEGNSLVEFVGSTREIVTDHRRVYNVQEFLKIVQEFIAPDLSE